MEDGARYVTCIADNFVVPPTLNVTELAPSLYDHVVEDSVPRLPDLTLISKSELLVKTMLVILPIDDEIVNSEPLYIRQVPGLVV